MAEERPAFPRRDKQGRITSFGDLITAALAALLLSLAVVFAIDLAATIFGSRFGASSGWLSLILPVWLFVEEFRAWRGVAGRVGVAVLAGLVALAMGLAAASAVSYLPAIFSGGIGAAVTASAYIAIWFFGVRWLSRRAGDRG